jgi:hypothetical protein
MKVVVKTQKSNASQKKRTAKAMNLTKGVVLSECAKKFAMAIASPFHPSALGACVPSGNSRESAKFAITVKNLITGTVSTPVGNYNGHIALWWSPSLAYDMPIGWMYYSGDINLNKTTFSSLLTASNLGLKNKAASPTVNITYKDLYDAWENGVTTYFDTALAKLIPVYMPNKAYPKKAEDLVPTGTNVHAQNAARLVSFGIHIKNASNNSTTGGIYSEYTHPSHETIASDTMISYSSNMAAIREVLSKAKTTTALFPITQDECNYTAERVTGVDLGDNYVRRVCYPFGADSYKEDIISNGYNDFNMRTIALPICFQVLHPTVSTVTTAPIFDVIVIAHMELTGSGLDGRLTPSHRDEVGNSIVIDAANRAVAQGGYSGSDQGKTILKFIAEALRSGFHHSFTYVANNPRIQKAALDAATRGLGALFL